MEEFEHIMKVISLASANISINNTNRGDLISFGGGGKQLGQITYSFDNQMFNVQTTADGGYAVSHNASKSGKVTIQFNQTSPVIDTLCEYLLWCRDNPEIANANITITDSSGVINMEAKDCFPNEYPQNEIGESAAQRTFTFVCGVIIPKEYLSGGSN